MLQGEVLPQYFFSEVAGAQQRCEEIFREVESREGFILHEIGFDKNHVHLDLDLGPTYTVADVAKKLKGTPGRKLLKEFSHMKRKYFWGSGLWSPAVYFDSVGDQNSDEIGAYVRNQGKKKRDTVVDKGQRSLMDFSST
jgi:putative transposase